MSCQLTYMLRRFGDFFHIEEIKEEEKSRT
jgi:hypothetical protein